MIPSDKSSIPTPALLVDLDAFEANLKTLVDHCRSTGRGFRPHAKTHKCPAIARRQMAAGALGISVATVSEAESMVAAGIRGVLLTSPVIEPNKIARMTALAKRDSELLIAVGHAEEAKALAEAAKAQSVRLKVLVDVDIGDRRTGALPGESALGLAHFMKATGHLDVVGVQSYAGHASHVAGFEERSKVSRLAFDKSVKTKRMLREAGFAAAILSGGSTGTYNIDTAIDEVTEIQAGSYVFMDVDYGVIGGRVGRKYEDFRFSLTVLTTVVSVSHADRVTVDAGTKAFATDVSFKPESKTRPGLQYTRSGDEFGFLTSSGESLPRLGDRLEFFVPHCDPTVNLYDRIYALRGDRVEEVWRIESRKENS